MGTKVVSAEEAGINLILGKRGDWIDERFMNGEGLLIFNQVAANEEAVRKIAMAISALEKLPLNNESCILPCEVIIGEIGKRKVRLDHYPPGDDTIGCRFVVGWT